MTKTFISFLLLISASFSFAAPVDCKKISQDCLFILAIQDIPELGREESIDALQNLAFHAGRLGRTTLPADALSFLPRTTREAMLPIVDLGERARRGDIRVSLNKPITTAAEAIVARYALGQHLKDYPDTELVAFMRSSIIPPPYQAEILGKILVMDLDKGEYRYAEERRAIFAAYLEELPSPPLLHGTMALTLAKAGYVSNARSLLAREVYDRDPHYAKMLSLSVAAYQALFDSDLYRAVHMASAIDSDVLRLEMFGELYGLSGEAFIGNQLLAGLYDARSSFSPQQRLKLLVHTLSATPQ